MTSSPAQSVLVFDGDCGFCARAAGWARPLAPPGARVEASRNLDLAALGLTPQECATALQFVGRDGRVHSGARAVSSFLRTCGGPWSAAGWLLDLPVISWLAALAYRGVAHHRHRLPGGTPQCDPTSNA